MTGGGAPQVPQQVPIYRVAVDVPGAPGDRLYDYLATGSGDIGVGDGVVVPFGGRRAIGIVVAVDPADAPPIGVTLKPVDGRLGDAPLLTPLLMTFAEAIAARWVAPIAATVRSLLPPGVLDAVVLEARRVGDPTEGSVRLGLGTDWVAVDRLHGARGASKSVALRELRGLEAAGLAERRWSLVRRGAHEIEAPFAALLEDRTEQSAVPPRLGSRQAAALKQQLAELEGAAAEGPSRSRRRSFWAPALSAQMEGLRRRSVSPRRVAAQAAGASLH